MKHMHCLRIQTVVLICTALLLSSFITRSVSAKDLVPCVETTPKVTEDFKLTPSDAAAGDLFGGSVSMDGETVIIGSVGGECAYVYFRNGGTWIQQAKLTPNDVAMDDQFGVSVSLSGDTAIVGAGGYRDSSSPGRAYIFVREGGIWKQQAVLITSDKVVGAYFGFSVSISGDTALIGSGSSDSAYIFTRSDDVWIEQAKLIASDAATNKNQFGVSVSLSGDTAIIGANTDNDGGEASGSAYIFTRSGANWTQQAKLKASDAAAEDMFGDSVSVSGNTVIIGATGDDSDDDQKLYAGSAYVYTRSGGIWTQQDKLATNCMGMFGDSVSISGDTAIIGASTEYDGNFHSLGAAYLYTRIGTVWTQQQKFKASKETLAGSFGNSVSISGDTVIIGAWFSDDGDKIRSGSAFIFDLPKPKP